MRRSHLRLMLFSFASNDPEATNMVAVHVTDSDLAGAGTVDVIVTSDSDTTGLAMPLTELTPASFSAMLTISATSTSATPPTIKATHGDSVIATYTDLDSGFGTLNIPVVLIVDAEGPVISNTSPPHQHASNSVSQVLQAEVADAVSGVGASSVEVENNVTVTVGEVALIPAVTDLGGGSWRVSISLGLGVGAHEWEVTAKDVFGNKAASDADSGTAGNQPFELEIDLSVPLISEAVTGDIANTTTDPVSIDTTTDDRKSIRVGFDDAMDSASVDADGSDFRVLLEAVVLTVVSAEHFPEIPEHVFLTLVDKLPLDAEPVVRLIGFVADVAGNLSASGEVTASDGLAHVPLSSASQLGLVALTLVLALLLMRGRVRSALAGRDR